MINLELPPLIPRDDLFGNPDKVSPKISPDAKRLAYIAPDEGVLNVWVRTLGQSDDRAVTKDRKRGIRAFTWAYDGERLLYVQDLDGDENWHVWTVGLSSGIIRDLTPFQGVQARVVAADHRNPGEILVGMNVRDSRLHDVYRVNLESGAVTLEVENPGEVVGWTPDSDMKIRGATHAMPDGGFDLRVRDSAQDEWRSLRIWGPDEQGNTYGFTADGTHLYVGSTIGTDTQELRLVEVRSGAEKTLASNPLVDLSDVLSHPTEDRVQAVGFNLDRLEWTVLDDTIAGDLARLQAEVAGEARVISRNLADSLWIVAYTQDRVPSRYYTYERASGKLEFLFSARAVLEKATLAEMRPIKVTARDGMLLYGYITLPAGIEAKNLPIVLNVHGGPWARDHWGYDPEAQWLANRGYACLQINFRGSTGFGKRYVNAGNREWGARMHDDLIDSVNWAVAQGYADANRVAIYGGSYGGYAALAGAAFTPDVFACAVDIVGPSSILTLINSIPPYWEPLKRLFTVRVGDAEKDREMLESRSPLNKAHEIRIPMLIAQGANDPRVKQAESEQIVAAMRERNLPVEYMVFEDEGHGFARPENRLKFYAAAERFLAMHLGGRALSE